MKKFTKVCLIVAAVLGVLGISFSIAGAFSGATLEQFQDMVYWDDEDHTFVTRDGKMNDFEKSYRDIDSLYLDLGNTEMVVKAADGDEFKVYAQNIGSSFLCEDENGTLHIENEYYRKGLFRRDKTAYVTLEVPKGTVFKSADIEVGVGSLEAYDFLCEDVVIECGVGRTYISGQIQGDCNIECGIGEVSLVLSNQEEDFDYEVECGIGEVQVGGSSYSGLSRTQEIDNDADNEMDINCGIGKVQVTFE